MARTITGKDLCRECFSKSVEPAKGDEPAYCAGIFTCDECGTPLTGYDSFDA